MIDTPKISGLEFLNKVSPKEENGVRIVPEKETVFTAVYDARGTDIKDTDFPSEINNPLACHVSGARAAVFIKRCDELSKKGELTIKPTNRDYLEVAKSSFIKSGGKPEHFRSELKDYKTVYETGKIMPHIIGQRKLQTGGRASLGA